MNSSTIRPGSRSGPATGSACSAPTKATYFCMRRRDGGRRYGRGGRQSCRIGTRRQGLRPQCRRASIGVPVSATVEADGRPRRLRRRDPGPLSAERGDPEPPARSCSRRRSPTPPCRQRRAAEILRRRLRAQAPRRSPSHGRAAQLPGEASTGECRGSGEAGAGSATAAGDAGGGRASTTLDYTKALSDALKVAAAQKGCRVAAAE